ncbi:hypothetical protein H4V97_002430 [Flavobacterium sp. CG_23.5]|nr:hypothetical protein [Flavobacterium sp. CG_9.10]MBP2284112.1 hypothetical protein [Flavobacterium sp. CG_23.5]
MLEFENDYLLIQLKIIYNEHNKKIIDGSYTIAFNHNN